MKNVLDQERATYEEAWALEAYGDFSPGEKYMPIFISMIGGPPPGAPYTLPGAREPFVSGRTVLDAGTGSGKGALALAAQGFRVTCCDFTSAGLVDEARTFPFHEVCLWHDLGHLGRYDYAYCCDVMEHIPTEYTMLVVSRILGTCREGAFFSISLVPDSFGVWVGKPLHQTVQPYTWWRDRLNDIGTVVEARDLGTNGVYLVRP